VINKFAKRRKERTELGRYGGTKRQGTERMQDLRIPHDVLVNGRGWLRIDPGIDHAGTLARNIQKKTNGASNAEEARRERGQYAPVGIGGNGGFGSRGDPDRLLKGATFAAAS